MPKHLVIFGSNTQFDKHIAVSLAEEAIRNKKAVLYFVDNEKEKNKADSFLAAYKEKLTRINIVDFNELPKSGEALIISVDRESASETAKAIEISELAIKTSSNMLIEFEDLSLKGSSITTQELSVNAIGKNIQIVIRIPVGGTKPMSAQVNWEFFTAI